MIGRRESHRIPVVIVEDEEPPEISEDLEEIKDLKDFVEVGEIRENMNMESDVVGEGASSQMQVMMICGEISFVPTSFTELCLQMTSLLKGAVVVILCPSGNGRDATISGLMKIHTQTHSRNCLFWIRESSTEEGKEVQRKYGTVSGQGDEIYLLGPANSSSPNYICCYRGASLRNMNEDIEDKLKLIDGLRVLLNRDRMQLVETKKIKEKQDREYLEMKKKEEEERLKDEKKAQEEEEEEEEEKKRMIHQARRERVGAEPPEGEGVLYAVVVTPFGRMKRRFRKGTCFQEVYDWVGSHDRFISVLLPEPCNQTLHSSLHMTEKSRTVNRWYAAFTKGTDFDSWGQLVEAAEEYSRLSKELNKATSIENQMFQHEQKKLMMKIAICLDMRSKTLLSSQEFAEVHISYEDIKKVGEVLRNLMLGWNEPFPVRVEVPSRISNDVQSRFNNEEFVLAGESGTLLPRIPYEAGYHRLTIRIDKIGLKDAASYINTYFSIHVRDCDSVSVTASQDTPVSNRKDGSYILFGVDVEIQRHIERLPKGTAIFFELKHYKPKKNSISTKCFAFMEQDEIRNGSACIELYQKPTDFRRKKLNLLTSKPLYLHLTLTIHDE